MVNHSSNRKLLEDTDPVMPFDGRQSAIAAEIQRGVCRETYAHRNRIERFFNKIKHSRRVATRYDKLVSSFLGFVQIATIRIWIRFVHTT